MLEHKPQNTPLQCNANMDKRNQQDYPSLFPPKMKWTKMEANISRKKNPAHFCPQNNEKHCKHGEMKPARLPQLPPAKNAKKNSAKIRR
ncbi:hypothetical protein, partial [Salmonella sp. s60131]|uniref:hypothetical protein n=1 Tax=Salmonella sp. s60131 TaxID=3159722 RepID=UPI003981630E